MHELSVASAVLNAAVKHAQERPVSVVSLRVGRLRQVVPDSLRFYFEIVARDTVCDFTGVRAAGAGIDHGGWFAQRRWIWVFAVHKLVLCLTRQLSSNGATADLIEVNEL